MIGKTISSLLTGNAALTALVPAAKIFPYVMKEDTALPGIVYAIDSVNPVYNKGGWAQDEITFTVYSFSENYAQLQAIVEAIRAALELEHTGYGTESISYIIMTGMTEGYDNSAFAFANQLNFKVTLKNF